MVERSNLRIFCIPEKKEKVEQKKNFFKEILVENFPKMTKTIKPKF